MFLASGNHDSDEIFGTTYGIKTCKRAVETVLEPMLLLIRATSSSSSLLAISSLDMTEPLMIAAGVRGNAGLALLPKDNGVSYGFSHFLLNFTYQIRSNGILYL